MAENKILTSRRTLIAGSAATGLLAAIPSGAAAQGRLGLSSILGQATDNALDKLAQPGAFYNDEAIRIGLPIVGDLGGRAGGLLGSILGENSTAGVLGGITRSINDAAGVAAGEAKPIFRDAIDDLSFSDAPGIIREDDGGTQYLRQSSNDRLHERLEPLVDSALEELGVYSTFDGLAGQHSFIRDAGLNRQSINRSVTDQGLDGIFAYIGSEERNFRENPLRGLGSLLGN
ncbi:DUF4197 domain-containing protein [Erythrobacter rubeus]|uniref:DUF4197 domain-containing protein n=1 Tax=Erythrobacter rubeus TaxID=2760803 RepID=A0ABR8KN40_9SPHN|nr:DUF4197 domain-containing protein [Erythrobacter rubeus]MBD2840667.1 DUF4197 domain-containing protein [Erythrobacter rubeus]